LLSLSLCLGLIFWKHPKLAYTSVQVWEGGLVKMQPLKSFLGVGSPMWECTYLYWILEANHKLLKQPGEEVYKGWHGD